MMRLLISTLIVFAGLPAAFATPAPIALDGRKVAALGIAAEPLSPATGALLQLPGRVVIPPAQIRVVAAPAAGLVEQVMVAPQQTVKRGAPLARLVSPMLLEAERDFLQAQSQLALAQANLARDEQLYREGIIGEGRLLSTRAAHAQAAALADERRRLLGLMGTPLAPSAQSFSGAVTLTAPLEGVVLESLATPGQRVEAAAVLFRIARLSPLWLELSATAGDAAAIVPGARVEAGGSRGRVVAVARVLDPASQNVMVRAEMSEGVDQLKPGAYVTAQVALPASGRLYRVPIGAVTRLGGRPQVFLERAQGFLPVPVRVLSESGGHAVIMGDFAQGERVVVKGVAALKAMVTGVGEGE